jgi:thymidylate synthase (FAD)
MEYQGLLDKGVAKDVARFVLPVNIYTQFSWVVNLRSLFNFISLRSHFTAMWEIRQYSQVLETHVKSVVPVAWEAFEASGRIVP